MEYAIAVWLGRTAACMTDFVVFVPALIAGSVPTTWRNRWIAALVALAAVLAIKVPTIRSVAKELDIPDMPFAEILISYGSAVAILVVLAGLARTIVDRARRQT